MKHLFYHKDNNAAYLPLPPLIFTFIAACGYYSFFTSAISIPTSFLQYFQLILLMFAAIGTLFATAAATFTWVLYFKDLRACRMDEILLATTTVILKE